LGLIGHPLLERTDLFFDAGHPPVFLGVLLEHFLPLHFQVQQSQLHGLDHRVRPGFLTRHDPFRLLRQ